MVINELLKSSPLEPLDRELLLCHVLKISREQLFLRRNLTISEKEIALFRRLEARRKKAEPVPYIVGEKEFMSLPFQVTPDVLIPRPETEHLVEWAIEKYKGKNARILDIGTGSGCIAVSFAKYLPGSRVTAVDISEPALGIARKNAEKNGAFVRFIKLDILSEPIEGEYDLIVSNPPYIKSGEIKNLMPDVRDYEPRCALDGGADGLVFFREIIKKAAPALAAGGHLAFEVGYNQAEAVLSMLGAFSSFEILKDYSGIERIVAARK